MTLQRANNLLIIGSLLLILFAWWRQDVLPAPEKLSAAALDEPEQKSTREKPFDTVVQQVTYNVAPRFSYELTGLVVSLHHSDSWWDYAHKEWNDHVNIADLCVVWGENVRRDAYRRVSYSHTQWECWWSTNHMDAEHPFDNASMSNNHIVTNEASIAHVMRDIHIGDEVRFRGYLIDYTTFKDNAPQGTRKTSIVRTDEGEGACEVVWVQELTVLRSHNRPWRLAMKMGVALLLLGLVAWVLLPAKLDD
jgi:hypothetical protein